MLYNFFYTVSIDLKKALIMAAYSLIYQVLRQH